LNQFDLTLEAATSSEMKCKHLITVSQAIGRVQHTAPVAIRMVNLLLSVLPKNSLLHECVQATYSDTAHAFPFKMEWHWYRVGLDPRSLLRAGGPQFPFGTSSLGRKPTFYLRPPQVLGTYKKSRLISDTLREVANLLWTRCRLTGD